MATHTNVRAIVPVPVVEAATVKARGDGKTLEKVVVELLEAYAGDTPKPRPKKTARGKVA